MRWLLILVLAGCGSTAAGERLTPDADPPPDASADVGTGAAGAGGVAGTAAGGAIGAAGAVAPSCAIPETAITATAGSTQVLPEGSNCQASFPQAYYPAISQGAIVSGAPFADKWTLKNYSIVPAGKQCAATIEFLCPGCAGNCDAFMQIQLTVAPQ